MAAGSAVPSPDPAGRGAALYAGRFAPTPSGPLHAGSLVAALASWLDARAHGGRWLVRIDDLDTPRNAAGAAETILAQLARCGLVGDEPVACQSSAAERYESALRRLVGQGDAYPCGCSRRELAQAPPSRGGGFEGGERVYPGTCRHGLHGRPARAWRLCTAAAPPVRWRDRRLGAQCQDVAREVGDFVLSRADGIWAYQLAVVVDDAQAGITDVVRGEDLASSTARQILLQQRLGLPTPRYLHTPLVLADDGRKLSKQNGARPLDLGVPLLALQAAGRALGVRCEGTQVADWLAQATAMWRVHAGIIPAP